MKLMNTFYVDIFPQKRADIGYVPKYERGYVPHNNRG